MGLDITGVGAVAGLLQTAVNKIWPDPAQAAAAKIAILQAQQAGALKELAQAQTNTAEAAQPGLHFRDGAGWVCVAGFAINVLKSPIEWVCALAGHPVTLPSVDSSTTVPMLFALLGLGTMHVYQQSKAG
jgi:hypothetical protein